MSKLTGRIIDLLIENGMTQKELSEKVGVTQASMTRYIKGERIPKATLIVKFADVLGCTTDYLLGVVDEDRPTKGCDRCDANRVDWDWDTLPINAGDFGEYELTASVSGYRKRMTVEFEEVGHEPIISTHFKINYCPYCGRKF